MSRTSVDDIAPCAPSSVRAASCRHAASRTVGDAFPSPACTYPLVPPLRAPQPRDHAVRRPVQLCRRSGSPLRALPLDRPRRGAASRRTCAHLARRDRRATAGHVDALHATPGARFITVISFYSHPCSNTLANLTFRMSRHIGWHT